MRIFNQDISVLGDLTLNTSNSYGNFLTIDGTGIVRYRTPAEVLGDIGAIEEAPNDGQEWVRKNEGWVLNTGASSGETNTASSQGTGESLYYQKVGSDLQFYSIKSENNLLTVSLDSSTNDIELTVNQANISITESQISDLQAYVLPGANISIFNNDSGYITDYTVTEGDVTAHEAALSLTISQLSDFPTNVSHFTNDAGYITSFTNNYVSGVSFSTVTGDLTFTRNGLADIVTNLDGRYLTTETDSQTLSWNSSTGDITISNGNSISLDGRYLTSYTETDPIFSAHTVSTIVDGTGLLKNDGAGNWSYDNNTYLTSFTETNDLTTSVTWADVPDANITQSSVTQHQAALSITESQISDLQNYLLAGDNVSLLTNDAGYITSADVVSSQWDNVTGGINYAGGNVGIGITSPSAKLHVAGQVFVNNSTFKITNNSITNYYDSNQMNSYGTYYDWKFSGNNVMRINSSGNVGIGTTSPSEKLDVDGVGKINGVKVGEINGAERHISSHSDGGSLVLNGGTKNDASANKIRLMGSTFNASGGGIAFTTSNLQRAFMDSSGNLGIGTGSPEEILHVLTTNEIGFKLERDSGSGTVGFEIKSNVTGDTGNGIIKFSDTTAVAGQIEYEHANDSMRFYTVASEAMRIDSSGNVGIGTTQPQYKLDIFQSEATAQLRLEGGKSTVTSIGEINAEILFGSNDASVFAPNIGSKISSITESANGSIVGLGFFTYLQTTDTLGEVMRVGGNGNVGIGTSSPTRPLEIGTTTTNGEAIRLGGDASYGATIHYSRGGSYNWIAGVGGGSSTLSNIPASYWGVEDSTQSNAVRLAIAHTTGNVGIGNTTPTEKLSVNGNVLSDSFITDGGTSSQFVMGDGSLKDYAEPAVVWTSAAGDNTTQGADTWYKVATYNITSNFGGGSWAYNFNVSNVGNATIAEVAIHLRRNADVNTYNVDIDCKSLTHLNGTAFLEKDSFLIVSNDASDIELWVKKKQNFGVVNATLISERQNETTVTYEPDTNSWTSITPSGTGDTQQSAAFRYINNGGAGTVDASTVMIVGDSTTSAGLSILGSTSGYSKLNFSDTGNEYAGQIEYDHKTNIMTFKTDGTARFSIRENGGVEVKKESYADSELNNGNSSTAITVDWTSKNYQNVTLTDTCVFTFTPPSGVTTLILKLTQDATGSRTVTFPASVLWSGGTAPTLTTDANAVDLISFYYDGTNYIGGFLSDVK